MALLVIFRHGQSVWIDVELTEKVIQEAINAG